MPKTFTIALLSILLSIAPIRAAGPRVVVYPAPAGEILPTDYEVRVENLKVDVYGPRSR